MPPGVSLPGGASPADPLQVPSLSGVLSDPTQGSQGFSAGAHWLWGPGEAYLAHSCVLRSQL